MTNYEFGDIVLVNFPQTGTTKRKKRPALVILDIDDADVVLAPITTIERVGKGDCKLENWSRCGLLRESWIRLAKVACLQKYDITRRLGHLEHNDKEMLSNSWKTLYAFFQKK